MPLDDWVPPYTAGAWLGYWPPVSWRPEGLVLVLNNSGPPHGRPPRRET